MKGSRREGVLNSRSQQWRKHQPFICSNCFLLFPGGQINIHLSCCVFLKVSFPNCFVFASDSSTDDQYIHLISLHCLFFVMCALKLTSTVKCKLHWLHLFESLLRALHLARQETQPTPTSSRGVLLYVLMPCASIIHFYRKFHNCASCTCPAAETETRLPTLPPAPEVHSVLIHA